MRTVRKTGPGVAVASHRGQLGGELARLARSTYKAQTDHARASRIPGFGALRHSRRYDAPSTVRVPTRSRRERCVG